MPQTASWIWTRSSQEPGEQYVRFRRHCPLDSLPRSATLQISADSRYRLYINGKYIAFGPSRSYPQYQCVDVHDVTNALQPGDNLIAVLVYQPGYSHYSYIHREKSGLWLTLEVDDEQVLVSDSTWKASVDPSFVRNVQRISIYGAGQEIRDLRHSEPWTDLEFDVEAWESASVVADMGDRPWIEMQSTPLKNLVETIEQPENVGLSFGPYAPNADPHEEMRAALLDSSTESTNLAKSQGMELTTVEEGRVLLLTYDIGHSQAGSARLIVDGAQGGETVLVSYLEKKIDGRLVISNPSTYCQMRMTDRVALAPGRNVVESFTPRGGRFVLLGIIGPTSNTLLLEVKFRTRRYPLALECAVEPEDDRLHQIAEMCWRTLQSCALDGMVDCPWREQASWVGDGVITASVVAELCGDPLPLRRMLQLASQGVNADGLLPGVVVNNSDSTVVLAYSFAWVEGLAEYLRLTNDFDFIRQNWNVLSTMLRRFWNDLDPDGLLLSQSSLQSPYRQFLDWADLPDSEPSCLYNLRFLHALKIASSLATQVEQPELAQTWDNWANSLTMAIRQKFYQHGTWFDDAQGASQSQHIAAFLTLTGVTSQEESHQLLDVAVARSLDEQGNNFVLMSPYMHYYLFLALQELGRGDDILKITKHRWSKWLDQGARTTWENWEVDFPDGSQCHAWSAHPLRFIARHAKCNLDSENQT